jgi:hypothetical protein
MEALTMTMLESHKGETTVFDMRRIGAQIKDRLFSPEQAAEFPTDSLESVVGRADRRRSPRTELEMLLTATTGSGETYNGYCRNLSREGAAALVWGELNVGDRVLLTYRPPADEGNAIVVAATVKQAVGYRYGFEFAVENANELHELMIESCRVACACMA